MSALRFTLRRPPDQRLDLSPLVPARLAGMTAAAIDRIAVHTTRQALCVADIFSVAAGDAASIVFEGGSDRFDRVGEALDGGEVLLDGDAGSRAGRAMRAGRLTVRGSVGVWAASGMTGGVLDIAGSAGDRLGGPLPGEVRGMAGGTAIVRGSAGERAGDRMRRGLLLIEGDAGAAAGSRMIAGTLVVCGAAGPLAGYLMRRGTLVLGAAELLPTFVQVGAAGAVFIALLARALGAHSASAAQFVSSPLARHTGDMATLGRGELLVRTSLCEPHRNAAGGDCAPVQ